MAAVTQLSYVVGSSTDLSDWRRYATEVLGLELMADSDSQLLYVRADERHHRIAVRAGAHDDVAYIGWDVASETALDQAAAAVEAAGVNVERGKPHEAADRRVVDFVHFTCPYSGVRMELVLGHEKIFMPRFHPSRELAGFRTEEMGLGHVVLYAQDVVAAADFYARTLGFGVTDYFQVPNMGTLATFLHCNPRHHSLAFMNIPTATRRIQHLMFETESIDDVGTSYDLCLERGITTTSIGRHQNDRVFSFYFRNPSGWHFEYGWGPRIIDPNTWTAENYIGRPGFGWGHHGLMEMV